jgi:integrase
MRGYLQKRHLRDGTLAILVRYSTLDRDGTEILRGETIRQDPGEDPRKTEERARNLLAERRTEVVRGRYVPPAEMTLAELVDQYLAARAGDLVPASIARYRRAFGLVPARLAGRRIDRLGAMDLQGLYGTLLADGHSPNGIRNLHKVLSGAFTQAIAWGIAHTSPTKGVRVPIPQKRAPAVWSEIECARFLLAESEDPGYGVLWRLMLATGMRIGEALALQWSDLDLDHGSLTIHRTMTNDLEGNQILGVVPKTSRSRRTIALPRSCVVALRQHRERQVFRIRAAGDEWVGGRGVAAVVFSRPDGLHLHDDTVRNEFRRAMKRADVPRIRPHDMRHTHATNELRAGTSPRVVADRMGISIQVLLDTYGHALPDMHRAAADAYDLRLEAATAELSPDSRNAS